MVATLCLGCILCLLPAQVVQDAGYLRIGKTSSAYQPREGDLVFFDDHDEFWTTVFTWAGSGPPLHMGIVVKRGDGRLALLEAGPDDTVWVRLQDIGPRLPRFVQRTGGTIDVRPCLKKLTPRESAALTKFAEAQVGKRYAVLRLFLQGTPFRPRGLLEPYLGRTCLDCDTWICSELAVAAGTVAGLFDPRTVHSNATFPLDLYNDERFDLHRTWAPARRWSSAESR